MPSGAARSTSSRPTAPGRRRGSPASARRSATSSPSSRRPGACACSTGSGRRSRPASSTCCRSRVSGPKTVRQLHQELGIEIARGPAAGGRDRPAAHRPGHVRADRGARPRGTRPPGRSAARAGCCLHQAEELLDGGHGRAGDGARRPLASSRPARSGGGARSIGDLDLLAETDDPAPLIDGVHVARHGRSGRSTGAPHKAAVRLIRGPQVDLMVMPPGAGRDVPDPLHRVEGAQRPAAGDGPRPRLEPVREGLPADRRGRRAADRRRRRAADVRDRGGGLRLPRPAVHRAGAARGRAARSRRRSPGTLPRSIELGDLRGDLHTHSDWSDGAPADRGRWSRRPAGAATPTRS